MNSSMPDQYHPGSLVREHQYVGVFYSWDREENMQATYRNGLGPQRIRTPVITRAQHHFPSTCRLLQFVC